MKLTGLVKHPARRIIWIIPSASVELKPNIKSTVRRASRILLGFVRKTISHFTACESSAYTVTKTLLQLVNTRVISCGWSFATDRSSRANIH